MTDNLLGLKDSLIGTSIGFIEAPKSSVLEILREWREGLGRQYEMASFGQTTPDTFKELEPLITPWNKELLVSLNNGWTMYLNNSRDGGDPFPLSYVSGILHCRYVIAVSAAMNDAGHSSTQFQLFGPESEEPLGYVRTIAAQCEDGKWSWHESGEAQSFEDTSSYKRAKIVDRFNFQLLRTYLHQYGLKPDDAATFKDSVLVTYV